MDVIYCIICIVNLHNTEQVTLVACNHPGIFLLKILIPALEFDQKYIDYELGLQSLNNVRLLSYY